MTPEQLRELLKDARKPIPADYVIRIAPLLLELWEAAQNLYGHRETTRRWHDIRKALTALDESA